MNEPECRLEPFFLPAEGGVRFCLLHRPPRDVAPRGGILYVHPFAEEMNKSRRMAAVQARSLASMGYTVLLVDLFGCGDSSGEIGDATVSLWLQDIEAAAGWMRDNRVLPLSVWGLRFGALLVAHWAGKTALRPARLILWQPVHSGETHLTQFLRVSIASRLLNADADVGSSASLRKRLESGETLEVAGYEISPSLAGEMAALKLSSGAAPGIPTAWLEVATAPADALSPASHRLVEHWRGGGASVTARAVQGNPFWTTVEIAHCPQLIEATNECMADEPA